MKKIVTKINKFMRQYFPYEENPGSLADFIREYPDSMIAWFTGSLECFEPDEKGYQECLEIIDILQKGNY